MKKIVLALAVVATVACFSSCKKTCTCKTYLLGQVTATAEDVELGDNDKCSDMNTVVTVENTKNGMECE